MAKPKHTTDRTYLCRSLLNTKSAKATAKKPNKKVAQKRSLNCRILERG